MKRLRHSRQPSSSPETETVAVLELQPKDSKAEVKMEKKLKVGKVDAAQQQEKKPQAVSPKHTTAPSGIVAKAKERFSQEDEVHIVRPKAQEQSISAPIVKKDVNVDHKENNLLKSVKPDAQKPAEQVPILWLK